MGQKLSGHPELLKILKPEWAPGCRRITPGEGYLETLINPDMVTPVMKSISHFTQDGTVTQEGEKFAFDAVVCATGFDVSFKPRWTHKGRDGRDLKKEWATVPESYLSVCAPGSPNYFMFLVSSISVILILA